MKFIRNTFKFFFLIINIIVGICFLICAYSPMISPVQHPYWACAGLFIPIFIILNLCFVVFWAFMKWKMMIVPVAFFLLGWNSLMSYSPINLSTEASGGDTLELLTYNVMQMQRQKAADGSRINPVLDYIRESGADIVCLQEYPAHNAKIKSALQKVYPYVRVHTVNGNSMACYSKYPVKLIENIDIESRNNASAAFSVKYKEHDIPVIVNHLESNKLDAHDKEVYTDMLKSPNENKVKSGSKYLLNKLADAMAIRGPQADVISEYIEKNYAKQIALSDIARETKLSESHLSVLFKTETGINFLQYLNAVRITNATHLLLQTSMNVTEIASATGFPSPGYFTKMFRRFKGMTPTEYRNSHSDKEV